MWRGGSVSPAVRGHANLTALQRDVWASYASEPTVSSPVPQLRNAGQQPRLCAGLPFWCSVKLYVLQSPQAPAAEPSYFVFILQSPLTSSPRAFFQNGNCFQHLLELGSPL